MTRRIWLLLPLMAAAGLPDSAGAQVGSPFQPGFVPPPRLSPYLNLTLGQDVAANYFLGVLPVRQFNTFQNLYGNTLRNLDRPTPAARPETDEQLADFVPTLPQTGHAAGFQTYGTYYQFAVPPRPFNPYPTQPQPRR